MVSSCTGKARLGQTPALSTIWNSYISVSCKVGSGISGSSSLTLTIGSSTRSESHMISYDIVTISSVSGANGPSSSLASVIMSGKSLGTSRFSDSGRVGSTRAAATSWFSDTTVQCSTSNGVGSGLQVSVTAGLTVGSFLSSFTYDLPAITSSAAESRAIKGSWCAAGDGSTCYCNGIVSSVPSNGVIGTNLVDSTVSIACTIGSTGSCYCFALPFTGGQHVTVFGQDFGLADYTPVVSAPSTTAQYTNWISQSSIICALPTCSDCGVSSTSQNLVLVVAGQSSLSTPITIPYSFSLARRRQISWPETVQVEYQFQVPDSESCPYFWVHSGLHTLTMSSGTLCRKGYIAGDDVQWIIDPCQGQHSCDEFQVTGESASLLTITATFDKFLVGPRDRLAVSSCPYLNCSTYSVRVDSSRNVEIAGVKITGTPYLLISWSSTESGASGAGWELRWASSQQVTYLRFSIRATYAEARAHCGNMTEEGGGWQLASISSEREQSAVTELAGDHDVWIGLILGEQLGPQQDASGLHAQALRGHSWLDGSTRLPVPFSNWQVDDGREDTGCVLLEGSSGDGRWRSEACESRKAFICSRF